MPKLCNLCTFKMVHLTNKLHYNIIKTWIKKNAQIGLE